MLAAYETSYGIPVLSVEDVSANDAEYPNEGEISRKNRQAKIVMSTIYGSIIGLILYQELFLKLFS